MEMLYSKYNRERLPKFQTGTIVFKSNDQLVVKKVALTDKAVDHVKNIYANYELLKQIKMDITSAKLEGHEVLFEYVAGESFEHRLLKAVIERDKNKIFRLLETYKSIIKNMGFTFYRNFKSCLQFEAIFGKQVEIENVICFDIANIDLAFENLIFTSNDNYKIIDYEWVFNFPIPVDYIIYRSVTLFFRNMEYISNLITMNEIWDFYGISIDNIQIFNEMNAGITNYVYGSSKLQCLLGHYSKNQISLSGLLDQNNKMQNIIAEKDQVIASIYNCLSWRVTAPLRYFMALFIK